MDINAVALRGVFNVFLACFNLRNFYQACQLYSDNAVRSSGSRHCVSRAAIIDFFEKVKPLQISHYSIEKITDSGVAGRVQVMIKIITLERNPSQEIVFYNETRILGISLDDHGVLHIDTDQPYE